MTWERVEVALWLGIPLYFVLNFVTGGGVLFWAALGFLWVLARLWQI